MAVVKTLIGNIKGPKGDTGAKGDKGDKGDVGDTGQRGSRWNSGTAITGTNTEGTLFSESGISDALVDDMYLNASTGNIYRCTVSGDSDTAMWVYTGNIKGERGDSVNIATTEQAGKVKPDGDTITVDGDGTIKINIDSELSDTSENPVKNSIVTDAFNTVFKQLNGITFGVSQNNCLTVTYDDGN